MADNAFNEAIQHIFANHELSLEKRSKSKHNSKLKKKDLELAFAVILVDLASCDQNFDTSEYQIVFRGIQRIFGTSIQEIGQLVQQATQAIGQLRGTTKFAVLLRENLSLEQRRQVMEVIEDVIQADGVVDGFEIYLRHKFADLLGVPAPVAAPIEV